MSIRELSLKALSDSLGLTSLCWKCSGSQGFYETPCPHCGAVNPNVDLDAALAQQDDAHRPALNGGPSHG